MISPITLVNDPGDEGRRAQKTGDGLWTEMAVTGVSDETPRRSFAMPQKEGLRR